jgi:hypothetical protein
MPRWNTHFFLTADNNLFKVIEDGLSQFTMADPAKVNVAVQVDSPRHRLRRFVLDHDRSFMVLPAKDGTGVNRNIGDPQTLIDFLFACKHIHDGTATMIVIGGHATGPKDLSQSPRRRDTAPGLMALGVDDTSRDILDNNELKFAFDQFRQRTVRDFRKTDILGCDACLTATVELAHQLRDDADVLVGSQDNEPANGWPYEAILKTLHDGVQPIHAAINIVNAYAAANAGQDDLTLSAIALDRMDRLAKALNDLGAKLLPLVSNDLYSLAVARQAARVFANFDLIDLYGFVEAILNGPGKTDSAVAAAATIALEETRQAVIATSDDPTESGANGLSVYLPNGPVLSGYDNLPLKNDAPQWHQFVVDYGANRQRLQGSTRTPPVGAPLP